MANCLNCGVGFSKSLNPTTGHVTDADNYQDDPNHNPDAKTVVVCGNCAVVMIAEGNCVRWPLGTEIPALIMDSQLQQAISAVAYVHRHQN